MEDRKNSPIFNILLFTALAAACLGIGFSLASVRSEEDDRRKAELMQRWVKTFKEVAGRNEERFSSYNLDTLQCEMLGDPYQASHRGSTPTGAVAHCVVEKKVGGVVDISEEFMRTVEFSSAKTG